MRVACHAVDNVRVRVQCRQQPPCRSLVPSEEQLSHMCKAGRRCEQRCLMYMRVRLQACEPGDKQ